MNFKRKLLIFLISIIFMMPIPSIAYTKVIPGGESIGITIDIPGVLVVGFYKVNNQDIARNSGLKIGDRIVGINDNKITDIEDLSKEITSEEKEITLKLDIIRENNPLNINLTLTKEKNGIYKTGMYVKDSITGIGTLTFITKDYKYGALGHAVIESNSENIVDIKRGKIFASAITSITKSNNKETGEKNAHIFFKNSLGSIEVNKITGIYGTLYDKDRTGEEVEVASIDEVKIGKAEIITVLNGQEKKKYAIEILSINPKSETKNFHIRMVDDNLINETGGIIKGMSGSPIIQNNKIIGAITHAIVGNSLEGYGISITKMLENIE